MKLTKLLKLDFIQEFQSLLESEFEHKLFISSLRNYASHGNPLRFHNFAFSMRELVLHVIERKAPTKKIKSAIWYERESKQREVTRRQQLKYCAQSNIADVYFDSYIQEDIKEGISDFLEEFRFFNKYTHITEKYFDACPKQFFEDAKLVVQIASSSLSQINDLERIVVESLEEKIHDSVIATTISSIPKSLSLLAPHVFVDYSEVDEVKCIGIDHEFIYVTAIGTVHVDQEYGPKDDLCTISASYPFTLGMKANIANPAEFSIVGEELDVDTSSWYE